MMARITAIASQKDVAPVFRSQFRSKWSSLWSSGFAAAAFVLAASPGVRVTLSGGPNEIGQSPPRENRQNAAASQSAHAQSVVVVTGKLDLGRITIADFGDVEPASR